MTTRRADDSNLASANGLVREVAAVDPQELMRVTSSAVTLASRAAAIAQASGTATAPKPL